MDCAADFYQLGLNHLSRGNLRAAYEELREASRLDPGNFEMWQKYEETYYLVEEEIDFLQANRPEKARLSLKNRSSMLEDVSTSRLELRNSILRQERNRDHLDFVTRNPYLYFVVLVAWLMTFLMVVYYFRARAHVVKRHVPIWEKCIWILLALLVLAYIVRRHRQEPIRPSSSDLVKILCLMVIFTCSLYHLTRRLSEP